MSDGRTEANRGPSQAPGGGAPLGTFGRESGAYPLAPQLPPKNIPLTPATPDHGPDSNHRPFPLHLTFPLSAKTDESEMLTSGAPVDVEDKSSEALNPQESGLQPKNPAPSEDVGKLPTAYIWALLAPEYACPCGDRRMLRRTAASQLECGGCGGWRDTPAYPTDVQGIAGMAAGVRPSWWSGHEKVTTS